MLLLQLIIATSLPNLLKMQGLQILSILFFLQSHASAFIVTDTRVKVPKTVLSLSADNDGIDSRRSFLDRLALFPFAAGFSIAVETANASGGATAGGAYLLSAKQRYNERVRASAKGLLAAGDSLKDGNTKDAKTYFGNEDAGGWKDLTAAGYLLSNAFRRNSSAAPDSLPSVKVR